MAMAASSVGDRDCNWILGVYIFPEGPARGLPDGSCTGSDGPRDFALISVVLTFSHQTPVALTDRRCDRGLRGRSSTGNDEPRDSPRVFSGFGIFAPYRRSNDIQIWVAVSQNF